MKVLIVDEMHPSILPLMQNLGLEVDYCPSYNYTDAVEVIDQYAGIIVRSKFFIDDAFLAKASQLRFIGRAGAGLDLIDLDAAAKRNVAVFGANEGNRVAVAEQLLGMILNLFNNIQKANQEVKNNIWLREENRGEELMGKTVGVMGYGNNGSETVKRLLAFGCRVLVYDKYKSGFGTELIEECTLDKIYEEADLVTLHFPLTSESKGWANADFFNRFTKNIYFCNVARGEIMVQADLIDALNSGKVKGACLDVLENEKLKKLSDKQREEFDFLKLHPRVLITPHVAGWTFESYDRINQVLAQKIGNFLQNGK